MTQNVAQFVNIGERTNVTGSAAFKKLILGGDYTRAVELNPQDGVAYSNRGVVYHDKGDYDRAIADYTLAININPKHATAYFNRAVSYRAKGLQDNADADAKKAKELDGK